MNPPEPKEPTIEAERAVLGAILVDPLKSEEFGVFDTLSQLDFLDIPIGSAFAAAQTLSRNRQPIDAIGVKAICPNPDVTMTMLMEAMLEVVSAARARHHAAIVRSASIVRQAAKVFARAPEGVEEIEGAAQELRSILDRVTTHQTVHVANAEPTLLPRILDREVMPIGIQTGYADLDRVVGGLRDSEFIVLAAQTSMGKSLFAANICQRIDVPSYFFSLEMSAESLYRRALFATSGVPKRDALTGYTTDQQLLDMRESHATLALGKWWIDDGPRLTPERMHSQLRRFIQQHGPCLAVVDYLQLMAAEGNSRYEIVSNISRELKLISRDLKVPVLALAQLSRNATDRREESKRDDIKIPALSDLRDSGSIEQDADVVIFLARDKRDPATHVVVAKNRNDAIGRCLIAFRDGPRFDAAPVEWDSSQA